MPEVSIDLEMVRVTNEDFVKKQKHAHQSYGKR